MFVIVSSRPFAALGSFDSSWHAAIHTSLDAYKSTSSREHPLPSKYANDHSAYGPKLETEVILAGDLLIEDASLPVKAAEVNKKRTLAAEMEGAGFAYFCQEAGLACCSGGSRLWPTEAIEELAIYQFFGRQSGSASPPCPRRAQARRH